MTHTNTQQSGPAARLSAHLAPLLAHSHAGVVLAIISCAGFSIMEAVAQGVLARGVSAPQVILCRFLITAPVLIIYTQLTHSPSSEPGPYHTLNPLPLPRPPLSLRPSTWARAYTSAHIPERALCAHLIWLRGVITAIGICLAISALQYISISEAFTVYNLKPFPTALLCWLCIGERFGWRLSAATGISIIAILFVAQPEFLLDALSIPYEQTHQVPGGEGGAGGEGGQKYIGFCLTGTNMLLVAVDFLICRRIGDGAGPIMFTLAYAIAGIVVAPTFMLVLGQPFTQMTEPSFWGSVFALTTIGLAAQLCLVAALQRETGGKIAVLDYLQIPMSGAIQVIFLAQIPDLVEAGGMAVIVAVGVWVAMGKAGTEADAENKPSGVEEGYAMLPQDAEAGMAAGYSGDIDDGMAQVANRQV